MSGPRGLNLSGTQVIASVLATLTGAIAASYLGVGGTLVGAAVGSISSTMGTEIYKHYLQRSQERLRTAGQVVLHHPGAGTGTTVSGTTASGTTPGTTVGGRHAASAGSASRPAAGGEAEHDTAVWDRRQYGTPRDPHETELIPGVATEWGVPNDWSASGGSTNGGSPYGRTTAGGSAANGGDRPGDTASSHAHGQLTDEGPAGDDAGAGGLWGAVTSFFAGLTRRQWLTYGGTAALFFVVVVAAIIVFQLAVGRPPLSSPSGGHTSRQRHTAPPSSTPSAAPTGSATASPTSSASSASSGTPTPSSGTPSPGTSGTASSPSTVPSPTPSTGSSGAVRSTTLVTPTP